jgi:hypothetical protein
MAQRIGFILSEGVLKAESKFRKPMQGKKFILPPRSSKPWRRPSAVPFCQLTPGYASLCQLMPPTPPRSMSTKPSSITNHLPHYSPSPGGEGRGEDELNLRSLRAALTFILTGESITAYIFRIVMREKTASMTSYRPRRK